MKKRIMIILAAVLMLTVAIFAASCKKPGNKPTTSIVAPSIEKVVVTRKNSTYTDTENTLCLKLDGAVCEPVIVTVHFTNNSNYDIYSVKINSKDYDKSNFKSGFTPKKVAIEVSPLFKEAGNHTFEITDVAYSTSSKIYTASVAASVPVRVAPQFSVTLDMSQTIYSTDKQIETIDNIDFMSDFIFLHSSTKMGSSSVQPEGYGFVGWFATPEPNITKDKRFVQTDAYEFFTDITLYAVYECLYTFNADVATGTTTVTGLTATGKKQMMINIPDELGGYPVRYIGQSAFVGTTVSSVTCNSGLIGIKARAFQNCTALSSINFNEGLAEIEMLAFSGCTKLNTMSLFPASLTTIGTKAFEYCGWKTNIGVYSFADTLILPNTLVSVGDACFQNSTFKNVYFEDYGDLAPSAEVSFGKQLLYSSSRLETVKTGVQVNRDSNNSFENKSNGLRRIPDEAFQYCKNLKAVTLSEGLESVGSYAFFCTSGTMENFKTLTIPDSLKNIGSYSFGNVPLTALNFKSNHADPAQNTSKLASIGDYAFQVSRLSGRLNLYTPELMDYGASPFWGSIDITSIFLYTNNAPDFKISNKNQIQNLNPRIKYYVPKSKLDSYVNEWEIQFSIAGLGTTYKPLIYALEDVTQDGKYSYTKVMTPSGNYIMLTNIFDTAGTSITVADTMSVVGQGGGTEVLPIKKIGSYVAGKTTVSMYFDKPENITEIAENAFIGSSALVNFCKTGREGSRFTDFTSLTEIGQSAFSGTAITRFEAPDSLRFIRNSAFFGAKHLDFVAVKGAYSGSNGLLLDVQAFYDCSALDTVVLGSRVNSIGSSAFGNCNNLGVFVMEHTENLPSLPTGSVSARGILGSYNGVTTIYAHIDLITIVNKIQSGSDYITYRDYAYAEGYWDWDYNGGRGRLVTV